MDEHLAALAVKLTADDRRDIEDAASKRPCKVTGTLRSWNRWQLVRILVADVSGHGPAAAETAEALRLLMRQLVNDHDQQRPVRQLNQEFAAAAAAMKAPDGAAQSEFRFATAVALTYDRHTGRLLFAP